MATLESRSGKKYVGQIYNSFAVTLDQEIPDGFLLMVNDSATDSDTIGIIEVGGETRTIPVWAAKKYPHVVLAVTTSGSTTGIETSLRGGV